MKEQEPNKIDVACDIKSLCINGDLPDEFHQVADWVALGKLPTPKPNKHDWVHLTNEEIWEFVEDALAGGSVVEAVQKAEAKLKEKNT